MRPFVLALLAFLVAGPARADTGPMQHIRVGGLERGYVLERFHADQAPGLVPIIIFLHGLGALVTEPLPARYDVSFTALPDMEPVLVARPQGVDRRWDSVPARIDTWQRLSGTDGAPTDDVAFIRALIDRLVAEERGDPARVYLAGVSAGGYFVARAACEMADRVAAFADVIATARQAVFRGCNPRPVPFAMIAGTTDPTNPYAGFAGDDLTRLASAPDTALFFARHDGCTARTETALPHRDPELASTATLTRFSDCAEGSEVLFWRVDGSGHTVPSMAAIDPEGWERSGRRNRDFETARVLWDFFRAHRLAP